MRNKAISNLPKDLLPDPKLNQSLPLPEKLKLEEENDIIRSFDKDSYVLYIISPTEKSSRK